MANSLKVSELERLNTADGSELLLVSKDRDNTSSLSSYGIEFGVLSSLIYDNIMAAVDEQLNAISNALSTAIDNKFNIDGVSSLNDIITNKDDLVTGSPGKVAGVKPIYDLWATLSSALIPKWQ